jgi:hypothetical protein
LDGFFQFLVIGEALKEADDLFRPSSGSVIPWCEH